MGNRGKEPEKEKVLLLGNRNQVTIPSEIIPPGTIQFIYQKQSDGAILLIPCTAMPISQSYFWTRRWQEGEIEADEDIRAGRLTEYDSAEALMAGLDPEEPEDKPTRSIIA